MSQQLHRGAIVDFINDLATACFTVSSDHGFWEGEAAIVDDYPSMKEALKSKRIALAHSELSEALEGLRKPGPDEHCPEFSKEEIEMADALIRILDYCAGYKLRIGEAFLAKFTYNEQRPYKHGKQF